MYLFDGWKRWDLNYFEIEFGVIVNLGLKNWSDLIIQILGNVKMDELRVGRTLTNHFSRKRIFVTM